MPLIDESVVQGHCLANPGVEYIVYQPAKRPFTLKVAEAAKPLAVEWFHPVTGRSISVGAIENGTVRHTPPAEWPEGTALLHVGAPPATPAVFRSTLERSLPAFSR
jgi:hypothetical protein